MKLMRLPRHLGFLSLLIIAWVAVLSFSQEASGAQSELSASDFTFEGPLGSAGTTIQGVGKNHFRVKLGHAPEHSDWPNKLQFKIVRHAEGNNLRLDVTFDGGKAYSFNEYFHSWSYDGVEWHPVHWEKGRDVSKTRDSLVFPTFAEDAVYVGHQVPMSYEDAVDLMQQWGQSPYVTIRVLGESLGDRNIYRATVTDPDSPHSKPTRWVHYFANQHPGEHNSQWRMVGMMDWLLSEAPEAADCRRRTICHFVLMTSPDAPSQGWYRVNAQGVDMNRSYFVDGSDAGKQAHEAFIAQRDLEKLMASEAPVTDVWSMHTWGGIVEPLLHPGPEIGTALGPWTDLRDALERHDGQDLVKPLRVNTKKPTLTYWTHGPHRQFGVTAVLCEGAGAIDTKQENLDSGVVLMKGLAEYYRGTK